MTEDEAPCPPEIQVQNWLLSNNLPSRIDKSIECHRLTVRGVPAAFWEGAGAFGVYTGQRAVAIFGDEPGQMRRAGEALRPVNGEWTVTLPPPAIDVAPALRRCAHDPFSPAAVGSKLAELTRWAGGRVYFAGRSFRGYPLARVYGAGRTTHFAYGRCALDPMYIIEGPASCWLPLEIRTFPIEKHNPSHYSSGVRCKRLTIRGVPAALFGGRTLDLFMGRKAIHMHGRRARVLIAAAWALRSLDGSTAPGERLAKPALDVRPGLERCASAAGSLAG